MTCHRVALTHAFLISLYEATRLYLYSDLVMSRLLLHLAVHDGTGADWRLAS